MGKTQSKRSVDITTDATKKGPEDGEVTGKLEKIEDLDQKQVNGDATPQENNDAEKRDADESENDKDLTTEKSGGDVGQTSADPNAPVAAAGAESPKEKEIVAVEGAAVEEISPLSDESAKKSKKEKVKKKWSFRSISFGKKDKQKPAKTEETETAVATNGDGYKTTVEEVTEVSKKDEVVAGAAGDDTAEGKPADDATTGSDKLENGEATENEMNGQKTPTPTEEKSEQLNSEIVSVTETTADAVATTDTITTTTEKVAVNSNNDETATIEKIETEKKATIVKIIDSAAAAATLSNGEDKNVVTEVVSAVTSVAEDIKEVPATVAAVTDTAAVSAIAVIETAAVEVAASIPSVVDEKPHQNGTDTVAAANGNNGEPQEHQFETNIVAAAAELSIKSSQIEVKTNTDKTLPTVSFSSTPSLNATILASNSTSSTSSSEHFLFSDTPNNEHSNIFSSEVASDKAETVGAYSDSQQQSQEPPPLPVSPPPSQFSVFAFNNQTEEEETTTVAVEKVTYSHNSVEKKHDVADEQTTPIPEPIEEEVEVETINCSKISSPEISEQAPVEFIATSMQEDGKKKKSSSLSLNVNGESVVPDLINTAAIQVVEQSEEKQEATCKIEEYAEKLKNATELFIATTVVDEITEKAIDIIEQNEEEKKEKQIHNEKHQDNPTHEHQLEEEKGKEVPVKVDEHINCKNDAVTDLDETKSMRDIHETTLLEAAEVLPSPYDNIYTAVVVPDPVPNFAVAECGDINEIIPQFGIENQKKTEEEDCLLQFEQLSLTTEIVVASTSAANTADKQIFLTHNLEQSTSKEIVDVAKDLKENAAAEITTQDLPVTCE